MDGTVVNWTDINGVPDDIADGDNQILLPGSVDPITNELILEIENGNEIKIDLSPLLDLEDIGENVNLFEQADGQGNIYSFLDGLNVLSAFREGDGINLIRETNKLLKVEIVKLPFVREGKSMLTNEGKDV